MERRVIVHDTLKVNRTDTLRFTALVRDSVYLHDSVYLEGATTVKERLKERWHIRTDTVWKTRGGTDRNRTAREGGKERDELVQCVRGGSGGYWSGEFCS